MSGKRSWAFLDPHRSFFKPVLSFKWQDSALLFEAFEDCVIIKINFKTISDDVDS